MSITAGVGVMTTTDKRDAAVGELLRTEAAYVSDMKLLVDVFILPLEKWAADLKSQRERDSDGTEADPAVPDLTQEDCTKIFANAKQLANFNRQFLLDLRRAYGGPSQWDLVSPVFRDSGNWRRITPERNGHDHPVNGTSALSTYNAGMDNASKLEGDPFRPSAAVEDVDKGPRQMLEVFLKSAPFLKMYSLYVNNFDSATERLTALERDNSSFVAFLTACEKQKPCRGLRLRDFLILPVQRIPRYRLLLETILQHTAIESSMHSKVEESLTTMGGIASKIDADLSLQEQKDKVYELQQQFGGAEFVTASRLFVKEGDLSKVARNGVEKLHFVLFNDLLVYGQAKRRRVLGGGNRSKQLYHHRREINLGKCFVVDAPSYGSRSSSVLGETGMLVVSEEKSFMMMASTPVEKDSWLQAIRMCMRELSSKAEARESLCRIQDQDPETPRSPISSFGRSSRWSAGSTHSPLLASAPRSVWVPGKEGHKSVRLVDFSLPAWAGTRSSCGCLSHTELTWGKEGFVAAGGGGVTGAGNSMANTLNVISARQENETVDRKRHSRGEKECPAKTSCVVSMKPPGKLGLRLRDVHPGCGGGVVVLGFESKSAGKKAGMKQGDRITDVDGVPVNTIADIVRALSRSWGQPSDGAERPVHLGLLRGFPKSDRPWLPPLEPSPIPTMLSPPSSAVESPSVEDLAMSPSEEPLALPPSSPSSKPFDSAIGDSNGDMGLGCGTGDGIPGFLFGDIREAENSSRDLIAAAAAAAAAGTAAARAAVAAAGAATATVFAGGGLLPIPPSPEMKAEENGDSSGDFSGSGDGTGDSAESSATVKGPAPPQVNANAGGDPAKPFASHNRSFTRQESSFSQAATTLTACLTCQSDGALRVWDDENSKPTEFRPAEPTPRKYSVGDTPIDRLRSTMVGACVGDTPEDDMKEDEKVEDLDDGRSVASDSSGASSVFLTAVSPRRIPPPLMAIPSAYPPPLPPISMTSSMVSGSFSPDSNGGDTGTPDTSISSMSWLKPLPPPPPRKEPALLQPEWESGSLVSPPPQASRGGPSTAYPPGRCVQTPPMGTPPSEQPETNTDGALNGAHETTGD